MHHDWIRGAVVVCIIGVLIAAPRQATSQTQPGDAAQAGEHGSAAKSGRDIDIPNVGEDTPVITLDGFCDPASVIGSREKPCRTVVTREEFEELAEASRVDDLAAKTQLAAVYIRFSLLAREAQKQGMDQDPEFKRRLEISRIQLLGQMLVLDLQAKSKKYTTDDLQKFFRENPSQFEQGVLLRLHIPETRYVTQSNRVQDPLPETAGEMKVLADKIYARARAGEDFAALQKQAFETAGFDEDPNVELGNMPRRNLRPSHRSIFDLKPGEISRLIHEPGEGYYIYKVVSKQIPEFESVKPDVITALQKQRMDDGIKKVMDSAKIRMSEDYFGAEAAKSFNTQ